MFRKAAQAVIAARDHTLCSAGVAFYGAAVIQHLVARFYEEQITLRRNPRHVELAPLSEMGTRELIGLAGVEVLLRPEVSA